MKSQLKIKNPAAVRCNICITILKSYLELEIYKLKTIAIVFVLQGNIVKIQHNNHMTPENSALGKSSEKNTVVKI